MAHERNAKPSTDSKSSVKKRRHFTKILIHCTLKDNKLRLPRRFVQRFGDEVNGIGKLKVEDGRDWEVRIRRDGENNIWFTKGWIDIVKYYSLGYGSSLHFKYEKDSIFHVFICDRSNCEIDYPSDNIDDQDKSENEEDQVNTDTENEVDDQVNNHTDKKKIWDLLQENRIYVSDSFKSLSVENLEIAMEAARSFNPQNPSLMVFMRPNYISGKHMYVPQQFTKKYLSREVKYWKLQVADGNEWTVGMLIRPRDQTCVLSQGWGKFVKDQNLHEGDLCFFELIDVSKEAKEETENTHDTVFMKFFMLNPSENSIEIIERSDQKQPSRSRKDKGVMHRPREMAYSKKCKMEELDKMNELNEDENENSVSEENDVCEFLAYIEKKGIYVSSRYLDVEERQRARNAAEMFMPKNSAFMVFLQSYSVSKGFVNVPAMFGQKCLSDEDTGLIKLQYSDGKEWSILLRKSGRSLVLGQGWMDVVRDLNLQEGYVCLFELVGRDEVVLKVSVLPQYTK